MLVVRTCTAADLPAALELCRRDPVANLFVAARLARAGIERATLGCDVLGAFDDERKLVALLHVGSNLVPVEAGPAAVSAFVTRLGPYRSSNSLMGPAEAVCALKDQLTQRWGASWGRARDERRHQPLMVLDGPPAVAPDPRVRPVDETDFDSYYSASVRMYTEEVGVSPVGPDQGYARHVRTALREGRAFGVVVDGRVVYKSDVGAQYDGVAQVQGVWLDPTLRGRGLAPGAMAGVVDLVRRTSPVVSLYVNDYNAPALATYRRVGFEQVGEFATILY